MDRPSGARAGCVEREDLRRNRLLITATLVLTAFHVVPDGFDTPVDIRVHEGEPRWRKNGRVKWRDETLDAALIEVGPPLPADVVAVRWSDDFPSENVTWESAGYPEASLVGVEVGQAERQSAGLERNIVCPRRRRAGTQGIGLGGSRPARYKSGGRFGRAGLCSATCCRTGEVNRVRWTEVLRHTSNHSAAEPGIPDRDRTSMARSPRSGPWLLALVPETGSEQVFLEAVKGSLERHEELIAKAIDEPLHADHIVPVRVNEALDTPERWLQLVQPCAPRR